MTAAPGGMSFSVGLTGFLSRFRVQALTEFCDDIARVRGRNSRDAYEEEAYKFMLISKFDAARAFSLYQNYKVSPPSYLLPVVQWRSMVSRPSVCMSARFRGGGP